MSYEEEKSLGITVNGKIHLAINGGTACGLGPKQFAALNGSHFHAKESHHITCKSCKNIEGEHDPDCGWVHDWHDCSCKLATVALKFPIHMEWEIYDDYAVAGSVAEGHDEYKSWKEVQDQIDLAVNFFTQRGHRGVYVRFKLGNNWLRS
ncbi:MAG: hypothetical protein ACXABY_04950 [Candidatus Thorarchaeota archaeon]|jgi:hypothetical protein